MPQQTFYFVGIVNDAEELISVYNGSDYVTDIQQVKLFAPFQKLNALQEMGSHQARNSINEVRVFKLAADLPAIVVPQPEPPTETAPPTPPPPEPPTQTAPPTPPPPEPPAPPAPVPTTV